ncbi:MAG: hypothetical protein A2289_16985 [Deltaproteobacteria bacterium RIFOXYA12_FULL_58_15]|nr:MAG: hypothetical protein A2289_16985 [Deltaproteobacteria bacterium RIFOXYA12_FULL_58_15]
MTSSNTFAAPVNTFAAPVPSRTSVALSLALVAMSCGYDASVSSGHTHVIALRPDNPAAEMWRYGTDDVIEFHDSTGGAFRVHYTRDGDHAVLAADDNMNGTPDFVEDVAAHYDEALNYYVETLGYRAPIADSQVADNGGDSRFDVYLLDFGGSSDGAFTLDGCLVDKPAQCIGYVIQENDFAGYGYPSPALAARIVGSHELFHAVQSAYDRDQGGAFNEGTAVWATEAFDPSLDDFEHLVRNYLENPEAALDRGLGYGQGLFFQFLSERFEPALIRTLLEACEDGAGGIDDPYWLQIIDGILQAEHGASFTETFVEFATWNLYTSTHANAALAYAHGADYAPLATHRVTAPYKDNLRGFYASTEYFSVLVEGRSNMTAALASTDVSELADLHLVLAVEANSAYTQALSIAPTEALPLDTEGATRLVVGVVNTSTEEVIRRPGFCIGTPDEVATCVAEIDPSTVAAPTKTKNNDGGCHAAPISLWAGLVVFALLTYRRRW